MNGLFEMNQGETDKKTDNKIVKDSECEAFKNSLIFDTIAVQFHVLVFIQQLLSHTVLIFFPFVTKFYSYQFWSLVFNVGYPICVYLMIIFCFTCSDNDLRIIDGGLWIPLIFFFQHRATIALKFATLSPTEYARYMNCSNLEQCKHYQSQMQLLSAWMQLEENVLHFELSSASARIGVNISNLHLVIQNPNLNKSTQSQFNYWNAYLRGHQIMELSTKPSKELKLQPNGDYILSGYDLALSIIRRANSCDIFRASNLQTNCIVYFFSFLNTCIPLIKLACYIAHGGKVDSIVGITVFFITSSIINYQFGVILYFLLYIAIVDVKRQYQMVCQLHCMLRLTDLMMHAELSIGVNHATEINLDSARVRLDAIMSIHEKNNRNINVANKDFDKNYVYGPGAVQQQLQKGQQQQQQQQQQQRGVEMTSTNPMINRMHTPLPDKGGAITAVTNTTNTNNNNKYIDNAIDNVDNDGEDDDTSDYINRCSIIGEQIATSCHYAITPRINLRQPQNVICWAYTRLIVQNFGERFRFRLDTYVACTLLLMVVLGIFALSQLFVYEQYGYDTRIQAFTSTFFIQCFLTVSMGIVFIISLSQLGTLVNTELQLHSRTLSSHALKFHYKVYKEQCDVEAALMSDAERANMAKVSEAIDTAIGIINVTTELKPFRILGLTAQTALTVSIITAALSFYSILASLYFGSNNVTSDIISNI